jgi:O-succinylbenzoic acid--CoA ligase
VVAHAVPQVGASLVPINTRLSPDEVAAQLDEAGIAAVIRDREHDRLCREAGARRLLDLARVAGDHAEGDAGDPSVDPAREHSVLFTSGTTGRPKGVRLTWANHVSSAAASAERLGLTGRDSWLACMPLYHVGGLAILVRSVVCGLGVVLHRGFDPDRVWACLERGEASVVSLVGTMLARLEARRAGRVIPPTLRCVLLGGGPVTAGQVDEWRAAGWPVVLTYGLTEAASQVTTQPAGSSAFSCGRPLEGTEVRIAGAGRPGQLGEILVRGPTVMKGYLRAEQTTAAVGGGWLGTGDLGRLDQRGELHVEGRLDDVIVSGGENVSAAEVEEVLRSHPDVTDVCVLGLPDREWGQRVVAAVVATRGGEGELRAWCRERLAGFKAPAVIRLVRDLPRSPTGTLLRRRVREEWEL